ncbi:MAG: D-glycero-beta-D-manno-heptose-7-phosphate kinase [Candidatus Kapaibacterium sp.]|jgi:rfaE bifunctional protein kinase chain/domain
MTTLSHERASQIIHDIKGLRIAVVGDVMLDRYFIGSVTRISPEAPVPVIDIESETFHLGGAANVAHNLFSLGVQPLLCGVIGDDNSGRMFLDIAHESGMNTSALISVPDRATTVKTRIIGNNQHVARLDREQRTPISDEQASHIVDELAKQEQLDGIIFEDYNKGVITPTLIRLLSELAVQRGVRVFVDPKFDNFFAFRKSTVFKPNRKEAQEALGYELKSDESVRKAGSEILERLEAQNVLLTLGAHGMMLFEANGEVSHVPTFARHVADVSGAGDTAIATLSACVAAGADIREAAMLANLAAGIVCGEPGVVSIQPQQLLDARMDA